MNCTNVESILDRFEHCARGLLNLLNRNTCIEQTRILVEVLHRFGVAAEPIGTKLHVVCDACQFQFVSGVDERDLANARGMGLDLHYRPGDAGSHTVALVERRWLVDLTVSQAAAEEYGFRLTPELCCIDMRTEIPAGDLPHVKANAVSDNDTPFSIQWIGVPIRDWESTEAWEPSHLWGIIDTIEARMLGGGE